MLKNIGSILHSTRCVASLPNKATLLFNHTREYSVRKLTSTVKYAIRSSNIMKSILPQSLLNGLSSRMNYNVKVTMPELSQERLNEMIIQSPDDIDIVVYHHNCMDGVGAQLAAYLRLGDNVQYVPGKFHGRIPDLSGKRVLFVDFVYPANVMAELLVTCRGIKILDHHISSALDLKDFPDELKTFDMDRSGVGLAWDYFHPSQSLPKLFAYIEDRDIWRYNLPDSKCIGLALQQHRPKLETMRALYDKGEAGIEELKNEGVIVEKTIQSLLDQAVRMSTKKMWRKTDYYVGVINSPFLRSDIGNELCLKKDVDFAMIFSYNIEKKCHIVSLRSSKTFNQGEDVKERERWVDVSLIAKQFGGGGHAHAASFSYYGHIDDLLTDIPDLYTYEKQK